MAPVICTCSFCSTKTVTVNGNLPGALIGKMISILVVWLHVKVGVSRSVANEVLQALQLILTTILHILEAALLSFGATVRLSDMNIPRDVRTAYRLQNSKMKLKGRLKKYCRKA